MRSLTSYMVKQTVASRLPQPHRFMNDMILWFLFAHVVDPARALNASSWSRGASQVKSGGGASQVKSGGGSVPGSVPLRLPAAAHHWSICNLHPLGFNNNQAEYLAPPTPADTRPLARILAAHTVRAPSRG